MQIMTNSFQQFFADVDKRLSLRRDKMFAFSFSVSSRWSAELDEQMHRLIVMCGARVVASFEKDRAVPVRSLWARYCIKFVEMVDWEVTLDKKGVETFLEVYPEPQVPANVFSGGSMLGVVALSITVSSKTPACGHVFTSNVSSTCGELLDHQGSEAESSNVAGFTFVSKNKRIC